MSNIVERLRKGTVLLGKYNMDPLSREAANRIERLEAALQRIAEANHERSDGISSASVLSSIAQDALDNAQPALLWPRKWATSI